MTDDTKERLAKAEAELQYLRETIDHVHEGLERLRAEIRDDKKSVSGWIRGIATGILLLFLTSLINGVVWLLNKLVPHAH